MDLNDIVTAIIALYAAVLSSYLAWREHIPHARITGSISRLYTPAMRRESAPILMCQVANTGRRPITLSSFGWVEPNKKQLTCLAPIGYVKLPHELQPGKSVQFGMWAADVAETLAEGGYKGKVKLRPICHDQTGRKYRGKRYPLALEGWEHPDDVGREREI